MKKTKPLDQVRPIGVYAPNRTTKLRNKSENDSSILGRLTEFASSVPDFRRTGRGNIRHKLSDIIILNPGTHDKACKQSRNNRLRQTQSQEIPLLGHAQE